MVKDQEQDGKPVLETNAGTSLGAVASLTEIEARLQSLTSLLLWGKSDTQVGGMQQASIPVTDLQILMEIPVSRLVPLPQTVTLLAEICRLLIKKGDLASLRLAWGLSHQLYGVSRALKEPEGRYYLFKGLAEIGLGEVELGIKNIVTALLKIPQGTAAPAADHCLAYWGLMSAALRRREIHRALPLAAHWQEAAIEGGLEEESWQASLVLRLLHLLLGELQGKEADTTAWQVQPPPAWQGIAAFLQDWTEAQINRRSPRLVPPAEPYPLFLGFSWLDGSAFPPEKLSPDDFSQLCAGRRAWCDPLLADSLSVQHLLALADMAARWELPQFLWEIEAVIKRQDCDCYLHFSMGRLLGQAGMESLVSSTHPLPSKAITHGPVIIWLMDVRGYTRWAEDQGAEENFALLSPLFKIVHEELEEAGGRLLEFAGDCVIVAFNLPSAPAASIEKVLRQTARLLRRLHILNALSFSTGGPVARVGIGIDRGRVALGLLGGLRRCHLSVLGRAVNRAARIESKTKTLDRTVLLSARCFVQESPEVWKEPEKVNFSLRPAGTHKLRHVPQPVELYAAAPLVLYWVDFVPMGFVATPEPGVVYLDTGNAMQPGIIDHHFPRSGADSACELLLRHPEFLLDHLQGVPPSQIEFRVHQHPDLDCAATLYTAGELLQKRPRRALLEKLAHYVTQIDQGFIPDPEHLVDSLYGIFLAHQVQLQAQHCKELTDFMLLEGQLRVIDAALLLLGRHRRGKLSSIFRYAPEWFPEERRLLREDHALYREDLELRSLTYQAPVKGLPEPVTGLWLDHPKSRLFKQWARNDPDAPGGRGYPFLAVDWSQPGKNRFIISVDPEAGTSLEGLGELLEAAEEKKRRELGRERAAEPRRPPTNNSDPWYFGWGHNYTIIDSPREGTVLTAEEVRAIHQAWRPDEALQAG